MTFPTDVTSYGLQLYEAMLPLAYTDELDDVWPMLRYVDSIGYIFDQIERYVREDDDGTPGWAKLLQHDLAPDEALPWLAQFAGVVLPPGTTAADARVRIGASEGQKRGTVAAFVAAGQRYLTGAKQVFINERDTSAYHFSVVTLDTETPDPTLVEAAFLSQKPGGLVMDYSVSTGVTYALIEAEYTDYADVNSTFLTYHGVLTDTPGT